MYIVRYWEFERPVEIQEDAFPTQEDAQAFLDELLDNNPNWDGYVIQKED